MANKTSCGKKGNDLLLKFAKPHHKPHYKTGNTSGFIGNSYINTHTDNSGNTSGMIGSKPINTYTDPYGNTKGSVGNRG
jgi:hypothetical protein